jgi:tRNA threonylcarbamoyladenosine biosynthesis protein TsaE
MGGGKTTLIRALTKALGSHDLVSSPTFSIVNEYHYEKGSIFHFDMYRIDNENEIINIGFDEYMEFGSLVFIEWPEKIPNLLPKKYSKLHLTIVDDNNRKLTLKNN